MNCPFSFIALSIAAALDFEFFEKVSEPIGTLSTDGNALMIQQILSVYLDQLNVNDTLVLSRKMLSYGCWCQILAERKHGQGEPIDEIDLICKQYQQCSKCVELDHQDGVLVGNNSLERCSWETAQYDTLVFNGARIECDSAGESCGVAQCKCDEELAFQLAQNVDLFEQKFSTEDGFKFGDECHPINSSSSGIGYSILHLSDATTECCGQYPARYYSVL